MLVWIAFICWVNCNIKFCISVFPRVTVKLELDRCIGMPIHIYIDRYGDVADRDRPIYRPEIWVLPIYRYRPKRPILSASVGVGKTQTTWVRKHEPSQDSYLCSNAGRCVFISKQTRWAWIRNIELITFVGSWLIFLFVETCEQFLNI